MKFFFFLLLVFPSLNVLAQNRADIIIKNGKIFNGTGNSWFYGDVAVKEEKIIAVGNLTGWQAAKIIMQRA